MPPRVSLYTNSPNTHTHTENTRCSRAPAEREGVGGGEGYTVPACLDCTEGGKGRGGCREATCLRNMFFYERMPQRIKRALMIGNKCRGL